MTFDNIVIGSGLAGLGTALGLSGKGRTLVLGGTEPDETRYYPTGKSPSARLGGGGLGQYWHGVIPLSTRMRLGTSAADFDALIKRFYPSPAVARALDTDTLLVPWKPIRPAKEFDALARETSDIVLGTSLATSIVPHADGVSVTLQSGETVTALRAWLAANPLYTPFLLDQYLAAKPRQASDHVIGYLGQVHRDEPAVQTLRKTLRRHRSGLNIPAFYSADGSTLYTLRPARFDFAILDQSIEKRAVFGLPTSKAAAGIAGKLSPGLVAEALFNKAGLFPRAKTYSVFFQTQAEAAYTVEAPGLLSETRTASIEQACQRARSTHPFEGLTLSEQPALYLPGVHLHGTLDSAELDTVTRDVFNDRLQVMDASPVSQIGSEHHSFKVLVAAYSHAAKIMS